MRMKYMFLFLEKYIVIIMISFRIIILVFLHLPDGQTISAKLCQSGTKGLMSEPYKALGKWILRDLMRISIGQLVTLNDLNRLAFDSLMLTKVDNLNYKLTVSYSQSYSDFKI